MRPAYKIGGFVAALGIVFLAAFGVGNAFGPDDGGVAPDHGRHTVTSAGQTQ